MDRPRPDGVGGLRSARLDYVATYYRSRLAAAEPRPALGARIEADVCIVGGGLAGLTTALELARAGRSVCVLEAARVAWGASGRNGGFVSPGFSAGHEVIARRAGATNAVALHRLSIEGVAMVEANIADLAIAQAAPTYGYLSASRYEAGDAMRAEADFLQENFGYVVEPWSREQVRAVLLSERYHQGLYHPRAFHFDPLAYCRALAAEIERIGGRVFEESPALALADEGAARSVTTAAGVVRAADVVLAGGGYTGSLSPRLRSAFLPIATYVMLTRPDRDLIASAIGTRAAIGDRRRAGDYYRLVEGGARILWGGKITTRTSEPARLAELLHRTMVSTYPQLSGLEVDYAWSGLMAYARHMMPQIGALGRGLWHCTAFGGHGMNTASIGGRVIAEAILGTADRWRLFAPFGLPWNGGVFGRAAVQATYWSLQAQDALSEHRSA
jgi:gamma-glutamylputrescine oxidase